MSCLRSFGALALLAGPVLGISIPSSTLGTIADETRCTVSGKTKSFESSHSQAFFHFVARQVRVGDHLRIEWIDPQGSVSQLTPYENLPNAPALCFLTQLPIAGFAPASLPGTWSVRVLVNEMEIHRNTFRILGDPNPGMRIDSVQLQAGEKQTDITLRGAGFSGGSVVHVAQYTRTGGWKYIAALMPRSLQVNLIQVSLEKLPPGEYVAIVRGVDQVTSPARFLISTAKSYKLPFGATRPWVVTQGPYGSFSHWNNSLHAWDIAPRADRCVVAMRGGVAYTHDLGMRQTPHLRSFGNYITVDHGDGEFSHYAHLATGGFAVKNGQRVEQGQALGIAGNSGYTLGEGGGYHVHVHVTRAQRISSPSIPFRFDELPNAGRTGVRGTVVSTNASPLCDCSKKTSAGVDGTLAGAKETRASVQVAQWWSEMITVPPGSKSLDVRLSWGGEDRDLDLHLVAPSGKHYGWYGTTLGYTGSKTNPEKFALENPEPGQWRVSVQGIRAPEGQAEFKIETAVAQPTPTRRVVSSRRASVKQRKTRTPPLS